MKTNLIKMMMIMAVAMLTFASCSSDDDGEPCLTVPELVQHEQTAETPITLAFLGPSLREPRLSTTNCQPW